VQLQAVGVSSELLTLIGRWGEGLVYQILLGQEAAKPAAGALTVTCTWLIQNSSRESGLPYVRPAAALPRSSG
jgi:hypothetical protein